MDRRLRTNLLLIGAIAVLGTFIWLAPEPAPGGPTFALFDADESITRIEVREQGELRLALQSHGDGWKVEAPFQLPADDFQMNALLDSLHQPATRRYAIDGVKLADLGLDEPRFRLHVNDSEVLVGDRTALGNDRYLLKDGFVYLVSDVLSYRLQRNPLDYASKRVLPEEAEIRSITLPAGMRVAKAGVGWELHPDDSAITTDVLQALIGAWRSATAMQVTAANSVPRGGEVLIELADGTELRFGVEMRETELLLTRADPAVTYSLPLDAADELLQLSQSDVHE